MFQNINDEIDEIRDNHFLVEVEYVSVDPAMRGWISDVGNYSEPVPLNSTMRSFGVGKIIFSKNKNFKVDEYVVGWLGWQRFSVVDESKIQLKIDPKSSPLSKNLGVLGLNGITAYAGLIDICKPKKNDVVLVTTAAGSVGSAVGQLAKIYGCRTIGLTSSDNKVAMCKSKFGYDEVINYKEENDLSNSIKKIAPNGIDCFFDNVGGTQFDAVMENLNIKARIVICGTIGMPSFPMPIGPRVNRTLLIKRAKIEGLLVLDYFNKYHKIYNKLLKWYLEGKLVSEEDVSDGLENAPASLVKILNGSNLGKKLVRV